MKKYSNIIIDTDPGVDDALALLYAILSGLPIVGITTVYGNRDIDMTTKNALSIRELLETNIPVYKGAAAPLTKLPTLAQSHGKYGLGKFVYEPSRTEETIPAVEFLLQTLRNTEEKVTLVCMGPSTNIAQAMMVNPSIKKNINKVIVLGGVIGEAGNISPFAEFNVYNDPDAFSYLLNAGIEIIVIPANICRKVMIDFTDLNTMLKGKYGRTIELIMADYITYYQKDTTYGGFTGGVIYDVLTIAYVLFPEYFHITDVNLTVDATNQKTRGLTSVEMGKKSNCFLCNAIDAEKVKERFLEILSQK